MHKIITDKNPDFYFGHLNNSIGNGYTNNHHGYTKGI